MTGVTLPAGTHGAEALAYAARGVKIFPLWWITNGVCACNDKADCGSPGKHPRVTRGWTEATTDGARILSWWDRWPWANIGLPTGSNRLGVIDVDPGKGGDDTLATLVRWCESRGVDLMATHTVRTGSGGLHLYFRDTLGHVKTASKSFGAPGVDTRGRGGYVVAPPSLHASGERYTVLGNGYRLATWPGILTPLLDMPRHRDTPAPDGTGPAPPTTSTGASTAWALAGLTRECDSLRAMTQPDMGRNDRLNAVAYKMGRRVGAGLLDETDVVTALTDAAAGWAGHTSREIDATIRSGLTAGKARPHAGPAPRGQA